MSCAAFIVLRSSAPPPPGITYEVGNHTNLDVWRVYFYTVSNMNTLNTYAYAGPTIGTTINYQLPATVARIAGVRIYCQPWTILSYWEAGVDCLASWERCSGWSCYQQPECVGYTHNPNAPGPYCLNNGATKIGTNP